MELRFVAPRLARLDELDTEVLVASVYEDVRPAHGLAGLCDFRLGGRLSRLMREGFVTGAAGEVVLLPGKPRLSFDKVLLFGVGPRAALDEARFVEVLARVADTLVRLRARSAVVELPGRQDDRIEPARAAELLLTALGGDVEHDAWTLVEEPAAQEAMEGLRAERIRRQARIPLT